jgi:hypothetical protein
MQNADHTRHWFESFRGKQNIGPLFSTVVMGGEMWIHTGIKNPHIRPMGAHKCCVQKSAGSIMAPLFWNCRGLLLCTDSFAGTLRALCNAIRQKQASLWKGFYLCPHLMESLDCHARLQFKKLNHPPCCLDLTQVTISCSDSWRSFVEKQVFHQCIGWRSVRLLFWWNHVLIIKICCQCKATNTKK